MALDDLYRVKLEGTLWGQQCLNVFYYKDIVGNGDTAELGQSFIDHVLPDIENVTTSDMAYDRLEIVNLDNALDFDSRNVSSAGTRVPPTMPSFVSWGFQLTRSSRAMRNGAKRFAGVGESDVANNVATGGVVAFLATLQTQLSADLVEAGGTYKPQIVRFNKVPPYEVLMTIDVADAIYKRVTTQNSRKTYSGN